jgi:hypothetical protein
MSNEDLLARVGQTTEETEFYTPMPPGYRKGHHKYVIVVGTVMSGLGKGIFSSSLAKLVQDKGMRVAPIKMEGYLNIDSGTLNPYRHGEVFVLDDGMETDMDLGTYERLLDQDLSAANFTTNGQIMSSVRSSSSSASWPARARRTSSSSRSAARSATTRTASTSRPAASSPSRRARARSCSSPSPTSSSPARSASRSPRPPSSASSG